MNFMGLSFSGYSKFLGWSNASWKKSWKHREHPSKKVSFLTNGSMIKNSWDILKWRMLMLSTVNKKTATCWKQTSMCANVYSERGYLVVLPWKSLDYYLFPKERKRNIKILERYGKGTTWKHSKIFSNGTTMRMLFLPSKLHKNWGSFISRKELTYRSYVPPYQP